jgi:hypothetical protein
MVVGRARAWLAVLLRETEGESRTDPLGELAVDNAWMAWICASGVLGRSISVAPAACATGGNTISLVGTTSLSSVVSTG